MGTEVRRVACYSMRCSNANASCTSLLRASVSLSKYIDAYTVDVQQALRARTGGYDQRGYQQEICEKTRALVPLIDRRKESEISAKEVVKTAVSVTAQSYRKDDQTLTSDA